MIETYKPTVQESLIFAKTSSQIEGEESNEACRDHLQAWEYVKGQQTLTSTIILEIHRILQQTIRPDIAGSFRTCDVYVGGYSAPSYPINISLLNDWIAKYHDPECFEKESDVDGSIRVAHVEFERIHPFEDGNGRVGRIIMNWHRIMNNLPLLIIYPGKEQLSYYQWFDEENK